MRVLTILEAAQRAIQRLAPAGAPGRAALVAALRALETGELPGPGDYQTPIPPSAGRLWVRHLAAHNLWLLYAFTEVRVYLRGVAPLPPVPVDDEPPPSSEPPEAALRVRRGRRTPDEPGRCGKSECGGRVRRWLAPHFRPPSQSR